MIYEKDLDEAIAVCQGERHPTANTCFKLAVFMYLKKELFGSPESSYSFAAGPEPVDTRIKYKSNTVFSQAINGKDAADIWPIMDELVSAIKTINPRMHDDLIRKLHK